MHYWRDKSGREVDFVLTRRRGEVDAIECKWSRDTFDPSALSVFRRAYPKGRNYLVTPAADTAYTKRHGDLEVTVCTPAELRA